MSLRKSVRELREGGPLVDSQGVRCLRAACRDFLRKVVLSSTAAARPSLWGSVICRSRSDCSTKKVSSFQGSSKICLQAQAPLRKAQPPTKPGDLLLLPQGKAPGTAKIPSRRGCSQGP